MLRGKVEILNVKNSEFLNKRKKLQSYCLHYRKLFI